MHKPQSIVSTPAAIIPAPAISLGSGDLQADGAFAIPDVPASTYTGLGVSFSNGSQSGASQRRDKYYKDANRKNSMSLNHFSLGRVSRWEDDSESKEVSLKLWAHKIIFIFRPEKEWLG